MGFAQTSFQGSEIPTLDSFNIASFDPTKNYVAISNYYYERRSEDSFMIGDRNLPQSSGKTDEVFLAILQDFADRNEQKIMLADEGLVIMTGDYSMLEQFQMECGEIFTYDFSTYDGIIEFYEMEVAARAKNAVTGFKIPLQTSSLCFDA